MRISSAICLVVLLSPSILTADIITKNENFDTDPGWTVVGSGVQGSNYGYQPNSNYAGGNVGEAGGRFRRGPGGFYADVFSSSFTLDEAFSASGRFDFTGRNKPDFGNTMAIGFFNTQGATVGTPLNRMGISFTDNGTPELQWRMSIVADNGVPINTGVAPAIIAPNIDRIWSFSWDPSGGSNGGGLFLANLDGAMHSVDFTPAQRGLMQNEFDAFGFNYRGSSQPNSNLYADLFIDDVTYSVAVEPGSVPVPEPASLAVWVFIGLGLTVQRVRRFRVRSPS